MEETSRSSHARLSRRELLAALLLFAVLCLLTPRALGAHVARLEPRDLAAASAHVVVAVVEKGDVRWNEQRTLLFTDYTLRVEDRLRGDAPERITLSIPGGTLGSVSDETCLSVPLEPGARYLLFLEDLESRSLSPVVGAWQGPSARLRMDSLPPCASMDGRSASATSSRACAPWSSRRPGHPGRRRPPPRPFP